jgi:hypothetical protein
VDLGCRADAHQARRARPEQSLRSDGSADLGQRCVLLLVVKFRSRANQACVRQLDLVLFIRLVLHSTYLMWSSRDESFANNYASTPKFSISEGAYPIVKRTFPEADLPEIPADEVGLRTGINGERLCE